MYMSLLQDGIHLGESIECAGVVVSSLCSKSHVMICAMKSALDAT